MKLLLDTHLLLWAAASDRTGMDRLPAEAGDLIDDPANELLFSAVSIWEIALKNSLGRPDFTVDPRLLRRGLRDNGYMDLPLGSDHALAVAQLPRLHRDPFDRLLIAQAVVEGIVLLTADPQVAAYPGPIRKV